ncbi:hypothetical protein [Fibrobacter sp.]|uniref:hypothetical protein n=1 Tax=Fibrobacter sp. TaxID=35828 RepID=UPI00386C5600
MIVLPHLLSFLLAFFYKNFSFKKLWLGLWIAVFCALVSGYVFLLYINDGGAFNGVFSPALPFVVMLLYLFSFMACGFFGRAFDTKKIWHRLCVPFVVIAPLFIFLFFAWSLMVHPYAEISDEPLEQNDLAAFHDDYEMFMSEFKWMSESRWIRWDDDARTVAFRERNDSVFFKFTYDMCAYTHYDYGERKLKSQRGYALDGKWVLLDPEKSALVRNLKRSVENYSQELSPAWGIEGYASMIVLKDYKRKTRRWLYFPNAKRSRVYDAVAIEKTFERFMPPRETYTTLSYREVAEKCNEPRNVFVNSVVYNQQNNTSYEQVKTPNQKDSLELNNSEEK